ncbi:MAG: hypothetical protein AAF437_05575 [Pseudomonadota bacterium]
MRTALLIGSAMMASGVANAAPEPLPLGPGSMIFWSSGHDGGTEKFRETLIAQGDDFALYRTESEWSAGDTSDYFALFSGVYYTTCDLEMPTGEERDAIADLWPLTPGARLEIETGDGAAYEIGDAMEYFLMGKYRPAYKVSATYMGEEATDEEFVVLASQPLTVAIDWQDGGRDSATLVTRPKSVASTPVDTDLIGNCASLLNNQTDEN